MTNSQLSEQIEQEMYDQYYCTKHDYDFSLDPCGDCDDEDCYAQYCPKCQFVSDIDACFRDEWRELNVDFDPYPKWRTGHETITPTNL